jgi:ribonuclease P protein component
MTDEASRVDQADLSAEQARAQAAPRLPGAHGDDRGPKSAGAPPRQGPQAPLGLTPGAPAFARLTKRSEFLNARKGARAARPLVVIEAIGRADDGPVRFGFTATKRIGGAAVRNRAKRRLREAARALAADCARPACDYVLIARDNTAGAPWPTLLDDVRSALLRLRSALAAPAAPGGPPRPRRRRKDE